MQLVTGPGHVSGGQGLAADLGQVHELAGVDVGRGHREQVSGPSPSDDRGRPEQPA